LPASHTFRQHREALISVILYTSFPHREALKSVILYTSFPHREALKSVILYTSQPHREALKSVILCTSQPHSQPHREALKSVILCTSQPAQKLVHAPNTRSRTKASSTALNKDNEGTVPPNYSAKDNMQACSLNSQKDNDGPRDCQE